MVRAILINPQDRENKEIDWYGTLEQTYELIGAETIEQHTFGFAPNMIMFDEEAYFKPDSVSKKQFRFRQSHWFRPVILGNTLLTGGMTIKDGAVDYSDFEYSLEVVNNIVEWL
jgi:hypothetical protein